MKTKIAMLTDKGCRNTNEDAIGYVQLGTKEIYILADGLGGHGKGDYASQYVVDYIKDAYIQHSDVPIEDIIVLCQEALLAEQNSMDETETMKTTLACLVLYGNRAKFYHVGDSRVYWFHNGKCMIRSKDHSVPQMLVSIGQLKEEKIRHHEDRNRLLRVMGTKWDSPKYEASKEIRLVQKEAFLLCSDGFWEWIDERMMSKYLRKADHPSDWLDLMWQEVCRNGKDIDMDNYSAITVWVNY